MRILVAADSFKDALEAEQVCLAIGKGLEAANHQADIFPLADGGEGTAMILTKANAGRWLNIPVKDPLGRAIQAGFGMSKDQNTAFIEMAAASGIMLLKEEERTALTSNSYGTGQLIKAAIERGAQEIILCIGGSATNDGGFGMAAALGWQFLDDSRNVLEKFNAANIPSIASIIPPANPHKVKVRVLCDVQNPLLGKEGASHVYGPQKGASIEEVEVLDKALAHLAAKVWAFDQQDYASVPGAGAAGGLGFGAMAFLGAQLQKGAETVLDILHFQEAVAKVDMVITGEGKLDGQTLHGKLIHTVCQQAKFANKPVIALCGSLQASPPELRQIGLKAAFSISNGPQSLANALANTAMLLENTATEVGQLL